MLQAELNEIIEKHRQWLRAEYGGTRADLRGADLRGADLTGADLRGADLTGADLRGAVLRGADLTRAVLRGAVLRDAVLRGAVLRDAVLRGADLTGAKGIPDEVKDLRKLIAETVLAAPEHLDMSTWHGEAACGTTHCIAGWACHLAPNGRWIESQLGTASAARFLLGLLGKGEDNVFYKPNAEAMEVLKEWAKEDR